MLDLLYPLSEFLAPGPPVPLEPQEVGGGRMPEPYRSLLVHDTDMTSQLEAFHGERIELREITRRQVGESLFRRVVLVGCDTGRPVELGAIRIDLSLFAPEPRELILAGRRPLGTLLSDFQIPYTSRPRLFFRIRSDRRIDEHFGLEGPHFLYGRQNVLASASGQPLAEVVEILPPVVELGTGDVVARDAAAGELGTE
jgi:chorismate-pyruvate lyase